MESLPSPAARRLATDRWGFAITATEAGKEAWEAAVGALMALSGEAPRLLNTVAEVDPGLALGRALRAFVSGFLPGAAGDTEAELEAAERMLPEISPRERSAVRSLGLLVRHGLRAALRPLCDHLAEFPGDPVTGHALHLALLEGGQNKLTELAHQVAEEQARVAPDDCGWLGLVSFARAEHQRYDEAVKLAERALRTSPRDAHAAHALMHCHYETGEHAAGLRWLTGWLGGGTSLGHYQVHFPWHAAMHELAQGDLDAARLRCGTQIPAQATADIALLLWRLRLAKAPADSELARAAASSLDVSGPVPTAFAGLNVALCLAAADDIAGLDDFARRTADDPRPAVAGLLAPLARGLAALLGGRPQDSVDLLTPVSASAAGLGGSRLQRDIVEDTLLLALIDAGQRDEALALLGKRLDRRPPTHYERGLLATSR